jgi:polysaccharide export outer membrane protein
MTLLEAVAKAKGIDEFANPHRVAIFRQIEGQRMAAAFDLTSIRRGEMDDPVIYPGDVVVVEGDNTRKLLQQILTTLPVLALFYPY